MYDDLLVPTDGSDGTDAAIEHANALARAFDAAVHVLSVVDTRNRFESPSAGIAAEAWVDAERERAEEAVSRVADAIPADIDTERAIRDGTPVSEITAYAEEAGVDAIVMATHGRSGLDRYLMGSVTEKVVRSSHVPVLTVSQREEPGDPDES
ncbi:universal stress protein [Halobaculum gomorrense]|uniref:Nucleotide-binding universal stress protein, UspA family n=1 Tax=Halobaculum gomorrense TaxID=43928 RepID=A0A1M5NW31_9EURY|nr:universal stress protein [Halobaculum gomorrense]SHG93786.1 Nucleotide-binding universal stress protein, UspA family [Halobaculum gomorrense]